ncbi:MAG: voltage-gated chloride channel family protein [Planctomycetaceae bacterium]
MTVPQRLADFGQAIRFTAKWLLLTGPVGILVGSACALFLWMLDAATNIRHGNMWLIWLLPVAGAAIGWVYHRFGTTVASGNNLVIDEIHEPGGGIPVRMAPMILIGTIVTHLFGGSAGREGTAVQIGGSIASGIGSMVPWISRKDLRVLLMTGVAAGFGGVFGTPVAGAVFALEVLLIGRLDHAAMLPCLMASLIADQTCLAWGIGHTAYHIAALMPNELHQHLAVIDVRILTVTLIAGAGFGMISCLFSELAHHIQQLFRTHIRIPALRPLIGGCLVLILTLSLGTTDYLGLGVQSSDSNAVTIVSCFREGGATHWSWLWKLLLTAITVSSGFKGGEVTPLFFIGAAAGNSVATMTGTPVDLMAGLGFVAVFAGATNTPLACTVMGIELFGGQYTLYLCIACFVAYLCSGHSGIYASQRLRNAKTESDASSESRKLK